MNDTSTFQLVTIIGFNYMHPIASLVERLLRVPVSQPDEFQANQIENGYAVSIIGLTAFMIESAIRRTQLVMDVSTWSATDFLLESFPSCPVTPDIVEVFVARDVIAHNHVWEAKVIWDAAGGMRLLSSRKLQRTNEKYQDAVDQATMTTRRLALNVFPTRVNRRDAATVLETAARFFSYLERENRQFFYVSPQVVEFDGQLVSFEDFVRLAVAGLRAT